MNGIANSSTFDARWINFRKVFEEVGSERNRLWRDCARVDKTLARLKIDFESLQKFARFL